MLPCFVCCFQEVWCQLLSYHGVIYLIFWRAALRTLSLKSNILLGYVSRMIIMGANHYIINFSQYPVAISMCKISLFLELHFLDTLFFFFKDSSCTCYIFFVLHFFQLLSLDLFSFFLYLIFKKLFPCFSSMPLTKFSFESILPQGLFYLVFISNMMLSFSSLFSPEFYQFLLHFLLSFCVFCPFLS